MFNREIIGEYCFLDLKIDTSLIKIKDNVDLFAEVSLQMNKKS